MPLPDDPLERILMCSAMLVEGLLDLRAARGGEEALSKEHHADAI